jgi:hypothetical protein
MCPIAGQAFTFLLDEKSKQKNHEKIKLDGFSLGSYHPYVAFFRTIA